MLCSIEFDFFCQSLITLPFCCTKYKFVPFAIIHLYVFQTNTSKAEKGSGKRLHVRKNTYEVKENEASPHIKDMLASMKENMTDEEMKNSLMNQLDKSAKRKGEKIFSK